MTKSLLSTLNCIHMGHRMVSIGVLSLLCSLSDDGVALAELGLDAVGGLGGSNCLLNDSDIVSVDAVCLKSEQSQF